MADVERERRHHAAAYHPVLSDEPIEILQPRRRMIKIALINAFDGLKPLEEARAPFG